MPGGARMREKHHQRKLKSQQNKVAPGPAHLHMDDPHDIMNMLDTVSAGPRLPQSDSFKLDSSRPQSMLHVKREFKRFLSELGIYSLWLSAFALGILLTRDGSMTYQFANLFRAALIIDPGYDVLTTVDNFWSFLQASVGLCLAEDIFTRSADTFFAAETSFLYGNKRVGSLRIRQVRTPPSKCNQFYMSKLIGTSATEDERKDIQCYPSFSSGAKLEKTFKKEGDFQVLDLDAQPWFKFWEASEIMEMSSFSASFNSYPGSGFYLDVDSAWWTEDQDGNPDLLMQIVPQAADSTKLPMMNVTMSQLKSSNWVDLKTRAIFLDFSFYNPNINVFLVTRIVVEFLPSGIVSTFPTFRTVDPFRFGTASTKEITVVALFSLYTFMTFYYTYREFKSLARNVYKYFSNFWSIVTFSLVMFNVCLIALTAYTIYETKNVFDNISATPDQGALQALGFLLDQEKNFSGIVIVIMVIRLYKFCSVSRALSTLTRTLGKSAKFVAILVVLFLVAAFGFALSTTLILGQDNAVFSTTSVAMFTLLRAGFGDFDFTQWPTALGQILLIGWLMFSNSFLLNIVVAVICEAFVEVTEENKDAQEKGQMNLIDALWDLGPVRKVLALQEVRRQKMEAIETALHNVDTDGDGKTDLKELEGWLQESDAAELLGVANAAELMKRFDKDGTSTLEKAELDKLKEYVKQKRAEIESEMIKGPDTKESPKYDVPQAVVSEGNPMLNERIAKIEVTVLGINEQLEQLTVMMQSVIDGRKMTSIGLGDKLRGTSSGGGPNAQSRTTANRSYNGDTGKKSASKLVVDE